MGTKKENETVEKFSIAFSIILKQFGKTMPLENYRDVLERITGAKNYTNNGLKKLTADLKKIKDPHFDISVFTGLVQTP